MFRRGFTILEMMVVVTFIGLMIISLTSLGDLRGSRINKVKVAYLQDMVISLQEYKSFCRFYPPTLENGLPDCDYDWLTFRPDPPSEAIVTVDDLKYVRIANADNENRCYGVHIGVYLEGAKDLLTGDDDFYATGDLGVTDGNPEYAGCLVDIDFDGRENVGDSEGYFDIFLK